MEHHSYTFSFASDETGNCGEAYSYQQWGILCIELSKQIITPCTKIISVANISNVLGTLNPVDEIVGIAYGYGVSALVDGAQSFPHLKVDVRAMDHDFFAFSN